MSNLPGSIVRHQNPDNHTEGCEEYNEETKSCCGKPIAGTIITESDSMGDELMDLCEEHLEAHKKAMEEPTLGFCRICKKDGLEIVNYRDPDEGSHGPVYEACAECVSKIKNDFIESMGGYDDD